MKIVGLTGGIGSGKSTVAKMFEELGVPIYNADDEAKALMNRSKVIRRKLIERFGPQAYNEKGLNRAFIASKVFDNKAALDYLNSVVHPKVASHFKKWLKNQDSKYIIKEAAIIFEHGMEDTYDYIILVIADKYERINRILKRDNTSKQRILDIMDNQLSDDEKIQKADFIIENHELETTRKAVDEIHKKLLESCIKQQF